MSQLEMNFDSVKNASNSNASMVCLITEIAERKLRAKELAAELAVLEAKLKANLKELPGMEFSEFGVSAKYSTYNQIRVDSKRLAKDNPDIYLEFAVETECSKLIVKIEEAE